MAGFNLLGFESTKPKPSSTAYLPKKQAI